LTLTKPESLTMEVNKATFFGGFKRKNVNLFYKAIILIVLYDESVQ